MRLRLFPQIFILIASTALIAVVSMAGVMSLNLQRGFSDYLAARDGEELEQFAAFAAHRLAANGQGGAALIEGRVTLRALLDGFAASQGRPPPPGRPPGGLGPPRGPDGRPLPPPRRGPDGRLPPPPEEFGARVILFDPARRLIAGPPGAANFPAGRGATSPIRVRGRTIALAQLIPRAPAPGGVEGRFLTSQYQGAFWLAALLVALAALPAWGLARMGARRLERVKSATEAIAGGDFAFRLPERDRDELDDAVRNINRMAASLGRLDTARRRWLAEVSHELRTPLAALRGELDALEDGVRRLDHAAISSLNDEAKRLSNLIEDLHFLAVSDLSGQPCNFAPVDAVALCAAAVSRFAGQAATACIDIGFACDGPGELAVRWDGRRIDQLLANLFTNSLRYTDAPGIVRLSLFASGERVHLAVEDSAPAVPSEHLSRLFAPLYRLDAARSRVTGGSGLGLAVCEAIVRAHGGSIIAAPSRLGGLAIHIDLPQEAIA